MQTRLVVGRLRVILLVIAQDAMMVAADDHRGAVELTAGKVVGLEAAHVIQPALDAPRMVEPLRVCRRLLTLRRWSDGKQDNEPIFAGSAHACGSAGFRAREGSF